MEQLLVLNPRRRRRRANPRGAGGRFISRRRRRRNPIAALAANPRRRRRRRNPIAALAANPRRRRRRHHNPMRMHHRRRRRHNPRFSVSVARRRRRHNPRFLPMGLKEALVPAAIGGAGALTLDIALGYIPMPAALNNTFGRLAVKVAGAIGLGFAAGFVTSKHNARMFTAGALTVIAYGAIRDGAKAVLPATVIAKIPGLQGIDTHDLSDLRMGYTNPAPMLQGYDGMGAYMDRTALGGGLDAYMGPGPNTIDTVNQVHGYMNDGM